jgi:hypothetical protein
VCPLVEVSPGVWRLRVVVELAAALEAASAALDEAVDCLATEWLDDRGTVPRLRAAADAAHAAVVRFSTNPKEV